MPITRNLTGMQFGKKIHQLFALMDKTPDWEQYVSEDAEKLIKTLIEKKNMTEVMEMYDMKYVTLRENLLRASRRIEARKKNYLRNGQSELAQELFELMDRPNWEIVLTDNEVFLAKSFKSAKNFYALARELDLKPGNVAATLYGSNQKLGVIGKLKRFYNLRKASAV